MSEPDLAAEVPNRFVALRLLTQRAKELTERVRTGCSIVDDMAATLELEEVAHVYPRLRELYASSKIAMQAIDDFYGTAESLETSRPWFLRRDGTTLDAVPEKLLQLIGALSVATLDECQRCRFWSWDFNPEPYGETEEEFWRTKNKDFIARFKGARFCGLTAMVHEAVRYAKLERRADVFTEGDQGALLTLPTHWCSDFQEK